jgi:hypothetical protein
MSLEITGLINRFALERTNERIVILLYEGSLALTNEFLILARQFPSVLFVINLFLSEPFYKLDIAFRGYIDSEIKGISGESQSGIQAFFQDGEKLAQAANFFVLSETETKSFAARLLGITGIKRWHAFSAIFDMRKATQNQTRSSNKHRVLVPFSSWQLTEGLVHDMISIKKETEIHLGDRSGVEFHLAGYLPNHDVQQLLERLSEAGFKITSESRSKEDYAEMFSSHDAVWLPSRYYVLQSSGKALDALVQGSPIIAPLGTYGWREQNRWSAGTPGYSNVREARDIFLNLQYFLPAIASELERQNDAIRDYYSPSETILSLTSLKQT